MRVIIVSRGRGFADALVNAITAAILAAINVSFFIARSSRPIPKACGRPLVVTRGANPVPPEEAYWTGKHLQALRDITIFGHRIIL
jgi:hypothetical protein